MAISRTIGVLRQLRSDLRRCIGGRHAPALNSRRCLLNRDGAGEFHDRRTGLVREFAGTLALPGTAPSAVQDHRRPTAQQEVRTSQDLVVDGADILRCVQTGIENTRRSRDDTCPLQLPAHIVSRNNLCP